MADSTQQLPTLSDVIIGLDAGRWHAVHHAHDAATEIGLGSRTLGAR